MKVINKKAEAARLFNELTEVVMEIVKEEIQNDFINSVLAQYERNKTISPKQLAAVLETIKKNNK